MFILIGIHDHSLKPFKLALTHVIYKRLKVFKPFKKLLVLACGGDGTFSWISSSIDMLDMHSQCTLTCLPLGTGNDLSRCLSWGKFFSTADVANFKIYKFMKKIINAKPVKVDQWSIDFIPSKSPPAAGNYKDLWCFGYGSKTQIFVKKVSSKTQKILVSILQ